MEGFFSLSHQQMMVLMMMMAVETVSLQNSGFLFQTDTAGFPKPFYHF